MSKIFVKKFLKKSFLLTLALALLLTCLAAPALAYDESAYRAWLGSSSGVLKALPLPPDSMSFGSASAASLFINGAEQLDPNIHLAPVLDSVTYVPLRLVGEQLGAQVNYGKGLIIISQGDIELKLQLGAVKAYKSDAQQTDQPITFSQPPFVCDGATYVPLRFIAEAFGCQVDYSNGRIDITTAGNTPANNPAPAAQEALSINGQQVVKLVYLYESHTMGADVYELESATLINQAYQALQNSLGDTATPPTYVTSPAVVLPGDFTRCDTIRFLNAQEQELASFSIYKQYQKQTPGSPQGAEQLRPYPYVITDNLKQTSYSCTEAVYKALRPALQELAASGRQTGSAA